MVQVMKNRRYHSGIGRSPYEAMFGRKIMLGNEDHQEVIEEEKENLQPDEEVVNFNFQSINF